MGDARLATVADLDELYRRERDGLVRLAFLLTGSLAVAEDMVHDAVARVQPKIESGAVSNPGGYLRTAVVNGSRSWLRSKRPEPLVDQPVVAASLDTYTIELFDSLRVLSDRRRMAVVLRYWGDLSTDEIADAMECRPGTVSSLLHRALTDLRTELSTDD